MTTFKTWAYNTLSAQEAILSIDSRGLLLVYSLAKQLLNSYQLTDTLTLKLFGDFGLEIKSESQQGPNCKFEFETIEARDEFGLRLRRSGKNHEKVMQGLLMDISIQKTFMLKYNYKNSKQSKKYFWFSSDLAEIRWAPAMNSKKFSKVSVYEISNVVYGPWSANFQKAHKGRAIPYHLCFTIETHKKTIDLQAMEKKHVRMWLSCLYHIIQTKSIPVDNHFAINRFPFLCFRLKVTQVAHKLGLTFRTYIRLKLNKVIYNLNTSSSQVTSNRVNSSYDQNSSRLSQIQEKIKRTFVSHKRTSTLPIRPGSYDDKNNSHFGGHMPYIGPLYTDRRGQLNEFSRHSSASNVSLHYPLSQRVEHPCSYSINSTSHNIQHKTTDIDYGVDHRRAMTSNSVIRGVPVKSEPKSNDSIPSQWSPNPHENAMQNSMSVMKHSIAEKNSTRGHNRQHEASMNLYFNMDGSKEISNVMPHGQMEGSGTGKILPDNFNEFGKMTSPAANVIVPSTSQTVSGSAQRKSSPLSQMNPNDSGFVQKDRDNREISGDGCVEKENVSPNSIIANKKVATKPKMMPLNLKKALQAKVISSEKRAEPTHQSITEAGPIAKVEVEPTSKEKVKISRVPFENVSPIREQGVVKKHYLPIQKTLEKSGEKGSGQGAHNRTQMETSGSQSQLSKKKVKLFIDKSTLLQALHNSHMPTTYNSSNMANQSFAFEMIPGNLSIDISKIDVDLDTTTKSKVSFQEDKGENQFTSRFKENSEDFSMMKKREPYMGKTEGEGKQHEKHLMFIKNLTLGGKSEKTQDLSETMQKKSKFNLSLDTSLINLESENVGLRQQLDEVVKEKEEYRSKVGELEKEISRLKQGMEGELHKKDVYIESLLKNIDSLTEDRDGLFQKVSEFMRQNHALIEKENNRKKEVLESGEKKNHELSRLKGQIDSLELTNKRLHNEVDMLKRNNCELQAETHKIKESHDRSVNKRKIFGPIVGADMHGSVHKSKTVREDSSMMKEELEKERHFSILAIEENKRLKHENEMIKKNLKAKLGHMKSTIVELQREKERLKEETEENYQSFQEVWPHLLNIYEYQSSQNTALEVKVFTLSEENQVLRMQLKKKVEGCE